MSAGNEISLRTEPDAGGDRPALRAAIVDDEPLARARLRRLLEEQGLTVVAEADDSAAAIAQIEEKRPDIAFLDIQMPGLTGLQLAGALLQLPEPPLIVFVTGYSQYAAEAFERDALDYLLKPISAERLAQTIARVGRRRASEPVVDVAAETPARSAEPASEAAESAPREAAARVTRSAATRGEILRRVPIKADYAVKLLRLEDVISFEARAKAVFVSTAEGEAGRTYFTLTQLEELLPAESFVRIHDSYIVNLDHIVELSFLGNHSYAVLLSDKRSFPVGKTRYAELRRVLGL